MSMPQYQDLQTGPLDYNNYGSLSAVDSNKGQPFPNVNSSSPVSSSSSYNNNGTYGSSTMQSTFPPQDASSTIPHGSVPSSLAASLPGPYPGATPSSGIIGRQTGYSGSSVAPKFSRPSRIVNLTPHPRYPGQVSVFRWVVRHIYMNPEFRAKITVSESNLLYACYQQATIGPNSHAPPSILSNLHNLAIAAPLSFVPLIGRPEDAYPSDVPATPGQWMAWEALGKMTKEEAVDLFLETMSKINEDFMDTKIDHHTDPAARPAVAVDGLRGDTYRLSIREVILRIGAVRIQALIRGVIYKKKAFLLLARKKEAEVEELKNMLLRGITVFKLPVDGKRGGLRKRTLILRLGSSLATSRLYLQNMATLGLTGVNVMGESQKYITLSDIADIRPDVTGFNCKDSPIARAYFDDFVTIIGSKMCFDFVLPKLSQTRGWFVRMLYLLIDSCLSPQDLKARGRLYGAKLRYNPIFIPPSLRLDGSRIAALLEASFGVEEYSNGTTKLKSMWVAWDQRRLYLAKRTTAGAEDVKGIDIDDIAEIRHGMASSSVDDLPLAFNDKLLTVVGSETSFCLYLATPTLRNKLARNLRVFVAIFQTKGRSQALHGSAAHPLR